MGDATVTVSRRISSSSPEQVFAAWTDADQLAAWWWPQLAGTTYDVDARPGGSYRIVSPVLGVVLHGDYSVVDPPRRLAFTWVWQDDGGPEPVAEPVEVTVEPDGDATIVTVTQQCAVAADLEQGWSDVLDRLAVFAAGQSTISRS